MNWIYLLDALINTIFCNQSYIWNLR